MFSFIERLQHKPEAARRKMALVGAALGTAAVGLIWLMSFSAAGVPPAPENARVSSAGPAVSFLGGLTDLIGETIFSIRNVKDDFLNRSQTVYPEGTGGHVPAAPPAPAAP